MTSFLLSLISGAIGGNVAAGLMRRLNLGLRWNVLVGLLGGLVTGLVSAQLVTLDRSMASLLYTVSSSALGGGALVILAALIRNAIGRR